MARPDGPDHPSAGAPVHHAGHTGCGLHAQDEPVGGQSPRPSSGQRASAGSGVVLPVAFILSLEAFRLAFVEAAAATRAAISRSPP